jgi:large subunit ribosomal protein L29
MDMKELQAKSQDELTKTLEALREQARDLKFKIHSKEVKSNQSLRIIKKDIARILTLINAK